MFLIITFTIGLAVYIIKLDTDLPASKKFDYSEQKKLFNSTNSESNDMVPDQKNKEKKVDSEPELLDFSNDKKEVRNNEVEELADKSVNLNTAGISTLMLLPGIGEKTAEKIIEYRSRIGKFSTINELLNVKGIGEKKLEKIKKYLIIR